MLCPNGHENSNEMRFCGSCGAAIQHPETMQHDAATPPALAFPAPVPQPPDAVVIPPVAAPSGKRRRVWVALAAVVVLAGAAVAGFVLLGGSESDEITLRGSFLLIDDDFGIGGDWNSCYGTGGYDDFKAGMNVTVRDGDGKIIGSGVAENADGDNVDDLALIDKVIGGDEDPDTVSVDKGEVSAFRETAISAADMGYGCSLYFEVKVRPADFYEVSAGRRGDLSYSRSELASTGYMVSLTLGT